MILRHLAAAALAIFVSAPAGAGEIHDAAEKGDLAALARLVAANPKAVDEPDARGETPLHHAAGAGHLDAVKFLVEHHATIAARTKRGGTPLYAAVRMDHPDVVAYLLDHKADVNARLNDGATVLDQAVYRALDLVSPLIARGADPNAADAEGVTPLMVAAEWNSPKAVSALLDAAAQPGAHKIDLNVADHQGNTAVHHAIELAGPETDHFQALQLIVARGADVNLKNTAGDTPLAVARKKNAKIIADWLVAHGAKP